MNAAAALGALCFAALLLASGTGPAGAATPAPLPVGVDRAILSGLAVGSAAPGGSSALTFSLSNPLSSAWTNGSLSFSFYAFDPSPGTGRSPLPPGTPSLDQGGQSGPSLTLALPPLAAGTQGFSLPIRISVPADAPSGTYALRDSLSFRSAGESYRLASVGNFAPSVWANATILANGSPTLNLTRLGVSGVLPETAILVSSPAGLDALEVGLAGGAAGFAVLAGYVAYRRRGPGSRSGSRPPPS